MKKLFRWICFAAILCLLYLALTTPRTDAEPVLRLFNTETNETAGQSNEIVDQVKNAGQDAVRQADEMIDDAVRRADEALENAVEQADQVLTDAVESAAEGAKQGFIESLKESVGEFWKNVFGNSAYTDKQK